MATAKKELLEIAGREVAISNPEKPYFPEAGITKIELGENGGRVTFTEKPNIDPMKIIRLIQVKSKIYKFDGQERLRIVKPLPDGESRAQMVDELIDELTK